MSRRNVGKDQLRLALAVLDYSCGCIQMSLVLDCDAVRSSVCPSLCPSLFVVLPLCARCSSIASLIQFVDSDARRRTPWLVVFLLAKTKTKTPVNKKSKFSVQNLIITKTRTVKT